MISNHSKIPVRKKQVNGPCSNYPPTIIYILFKKSEPFHLKDQILTSKCIGRIKCSKFTPSLKCAEIIKSVFGQSDNYLAWYTDREWLENAAWLPMYPDGYVDIQNKTLKEGKE